jgi:hypothetical protein
MLFTKYLISAGLGVVMLTLMSQSTHGQSGDLKVSVGLPQKSVSEHLGIAFEVEVKNESAADVELYPYDVNRLPGEILRITFESPLALPPAQPSVNDFGFTEVRIPRFGSVKLKGYLQSYLRRLAPGEYTLPYSLRWEYAQAGAPASDAKPTVEAKGELQFKVADADPKRLDQYISARTAILDKSADAGKARAAAYEISLVDDSSVLPALMILKDKGYELEALQGGKRLPDTEALEILTYVASSSKNPAIVREAVKEIEQRGKGVPESIVRTILQSDNKWLQIEGLGYIERTGGPRFLKEVTALAQSPDRDVRKAAQAARNKLERVPPK